MITESCGLEKHNFDKKASEHKKDNHYSHRLNKFIYKALGYIIMQMICPDVVFSCHHLSI